MALVSIKRWKRILVGKKKEKSNLGKMGFVELSLLVVHCDYVDNRRRNQGGAEQVSPKVWLRDRIKQLREQPPPSSLMVAGHRAHERKKQKRRDR